ncbi:hypothetical protein EI94DRAFT_1044874 [Lactarius quietus]|nr:hypothetical protein EI94DRAFT_1044874 [Lactarius quietus]
MHIYCSGGSLESINSLELPPPPPTSELPGIPCNTRPSILSTMTYSFSYSATIDWTWRMFGMPILGDHLPSLPLFIDYRDTTETLIRQDELAIRHALLLRDRVRHIALHLPRSILHAILPIMDGPFSMLEHLSLSYTNGGDPSLILPKTFLAPNLRHLTLMGSKCQKDYGCSPPPPPSSHSRSQKFKPLVALTRSN